jgi:hypothetical protein
MNMEQQWDDTDRKTEELGEKPVPVPFCPPHISHGLPWVLQTQASTVRSWQLTN